MDIPEDALDRLSKAARESAPVPPRLGRYLLGPELGRGGMGVVYRAFDEPLQRDVALKLLRSPDDPRLAERLRREGRAVAGLRHPNIVALYDAGALDGTPYLAMELVEGVPLSRAMPDLELPARVRILEKVARAVDHAHHHGLVHRDLKPANILVKPDGEPVVMDFGLARSMDDEAALTVTGSALGTPLYMAPEQFDTQRVPPRPQIDVYALGVILYEMLAGRPPYRGESFAEVAGAIARGEPERPRTAPRDLVAVCLKAIDRQPRRRYETAGELADELRRWREGEPVVVRPAGPLGRLGRRLGRRRDLLALTAVLLAATGTLAAVLGARWIQARREAESERNRTAALSELGAHWMRILLARKDYYRATADPAQTRARVEEAVRALDAAGDDPRALFVRARGRLILEDARRAEHDLRRALDLDPAFGPAWSLLGRTLIERAILRLYEHRRPEVRRLLEEAAEALKRSSTADAARDLFAVDDDAGAAAVSQALVARYVRDDAAAARAILEKAPQTEDVLLWRAAWEPEKARRIELCDRALEIMPHSARGWLERGLARESAEDFGRAIRIHPGLAVAWFNRAVARRRSGDVAGALEDAREACRLEPDDAVAWDLAGLLRYEAGDFAGAAADLSRALEQAPRFAAAWNHRGMARFRQGDLDGALRDYEAALHEDPGNAEAHHNRALVHLRKGDAVRARDGCTRAIELRPGLRAAWLTRAAAREALGDREGAAADRLRAETLTE